MSKIMCYVLPVSDTHSNISIESNTNKELVELPLQDEKYGPDVGDYEEEY
jgi:hypothetical protein